MYFGFFFFLFCFLSSGVGKVQLKGEIEIISVNLFRAALLLLGLK